VGEGEEEPFPPSPKASEGQALRLGTLMEEEMERFRYVDISILRDLEI